jgi:Family of unknown function (DUF5565)
VRKIPTLFKRDPGNMRHVLPEVTPGCEWVLAGEGVPTRKYDGTCCMYDGERWWARREVKPGKRAPENFQPVEVDESTGKTVGWEPMGQSAFVRWHAEAVDRDTVPGSPPYEVGTYELIGPKINGNPEGTMGHVLVAHSGAHVLHRVALESAMTVQFVFEVLKGHLLDMSYEGIVWHHPDGRMAKLKRRDFT